MPASVDVLIPTYARPGPLAVTLTALISQTFDDFRLVVSDQTTDDDVFLASEVQAVVSVLRHRGHRVDLVKHAPPRGMAEHRQFLLDQATARYVLFLDDDVIIEPDLIERLVTAIERERCGFVGSFVNAPSAVSSSKPIDEPPDHLDLEFWDGPVHPEQVRPGTPEWSRAHVHFAAYPIRLQQRMQLNQRDRLYKVAVIGGCVLFDRAKLVETGGFSFWEELPSTHVGEDVLAQLRVMARYGGAGLFPSGAWHQEVPTTCPERGTDAPLVVDIDVTATHAP